MVRKLGAPSLNDEAVKVESASNWTPGTYARFGILQPEPADAEDLEGHRQDLGISTADWNRAGDIVRHSASCNTFLQALGAQRANVNPRNLGRFEALFMSI